MRPRETIATLVVNGDEQDVTVRGYVEMEYSRSRGMIAVLDGEPEAQVDGEWVSMDDDALGDGAADAAEEALLEDALNDDECWS